MLRSLLLIILAATAAAQQPTCDCQPLGPPNAESYLVTRLWNIVSSNWTDQDVIDEFNDGFAPLVTSLDGFQRYTAAATGNSSTVFFMNAFDSQDHAHAAQEAAKTFVAEGRLNGVITPNLFTEDRVAFSFAAEECVTEPDVGKYLATRVYKPGNPANVTLEGLSAAGASVSESFSNLMGFTSYGGSVSVPGHDQVFLFNIFDNEASALAANEIGLDNLAKADDPNNEDTPPGTLRAETQGKIAFDYLCAAGNAPVGDEDDADTVKCDDKADTESACVEANECTNCQDFDFGDDCDANKKEHCEEIKCCAACEEEIRAMFGCEHGAVCGEDLGTCDNEDAGDTTSSACSVSIALVASVIGLILAPFLAIAI